MLGLFTVIVGLFGACIGSFLNVVILRLPKHKTLTGRSYCPQCKTTLRPLDMVPILSYLLLRGACRNCKKKISPRYAVIEFITAIAFMLTFLAVQPTDGFGYVSLVRALFIVSILVIVFVIDLEHFVILDSVVFSGVATLFCFNIALALIGNTASWHLDTLLFGGIVAAAASSLVFFLLWFLSKGAWMGLGDVKLLLFLGLAMGWPHVWVMLFLSFFLGTLYAIPLLVLQKKEFNSAVPFGTFLSIASFITLLYGESILRWYFSLAYRLF